jgi:hypothetical protein
MRKYLLSAVFFALVSCAVPALACEDCDDYFDYQTLTWCAWCSPTYCGYFNCRIVQYCLGCNDTCTGDDYGCFEYGGGCEQEPEVRVEPLLQDRWRLTGVRVYRNRTESPGPSSAPGLRLGKPT